MNHSKHIKLVNCYQTPIKLIKLMKSEKELMPLFLHLNYMLFLWFSSKSVFESLIYPEINCSVEAPIVSLIRLSFRSNM